MVANSQMAVFDRCPARSAWCAIVKVTPEVLNDPAAYAAMARAVNPYGDGHACARIADAIEWYFGLRAERPEDHRA